MTYYFYIFLLIKPSQTDAESFNFKIVRLEIFIMILIRAIIYFKALDGFLSISEVRNHEFFLAK